MVLGAGGLGQFAIQYLKLLTGTRVVAVDPSATKRARALELGADEALDPDALDRARFAACMTRSSASPTP